MGAVSAVALPALSARMRAGGGLKVGYLQAVGTMSALQWPFLACLAILAEPVVTLILGPQWSGATMSVRLISLSSMFMAPSFMTYPVLVTTGRIRDTFTSSMISLPISAAITILAAHFGIESVAASLLLTAPFQLGVALFFIHRAIALSFIEFVAANRKSAMTTIASAAVPGALVLANGPSLSGMILAAAMFGALTCWAAALWWIRHPLFDELIGGIRSLNSRFSISRFRVTKSRLT